MDGNTGVLNKNDFVNLRSPCPNFSYRLSYNMIWKSFDLNEFFEGIYGNKVFNGMKFKCGNFSTNGHTSIPFGVFAYGPNSKEFAGCLAMQRYLINIISL